MANLYEINQQILDTIDLETGEIVDFAKFEALKLERDTKLENIALWIKNLASEAEALKAEKKVFEEREKRAANKAESLKRYLDSNLNGQKFSTTRVSIGYRKSKYLYIAYGVKVPDEYLKQAEPSVDKTALAEAIKKGKEFDGIELRENNNIQIK